VLLNIVKAQNVSNMIKIDFHSQHNQPKMHIKH